MDEYPDYERFMALSCALTGFSRYDLDATGLGTDYHAQFLRNIGPEIQARLLGVVDAGDGIDDRIARDLMTVPALRDAAGRVVLLWYVGSWYQVAPFGADVVSPQSYVGGLMWQAAATHPMGATPQGYGAWALPPPVEPRA
ncbi:hypothetical protein ASE86_14540 [Sphingomonas sp. Leaf33]|uniref:hypothetical protein n=1 Tax=Sphingomonas sp. Leaf33 TaxID=1736215 RepID=UPI0007001B8C|nr:hypothetical protein [Sphingomonas sp. Leaf33]KQN21440.1 hypothetical protein ASE86_14540 [Sphingomonas sp. Leaf33]